MAGSGSPISEQGGELGGSGFGDTGMIGGDHATGRNSLFVKQFKKTTLCKHFLHGYCIYGTGCDFAHSQGELHHRPDLRKTKLCPGFMRRHCSAGANCDFAHGHQELRYTNIFYKSAVCGEWAKHGRCSRGNRCRYAHGTQDAPGHYVNGWWEVAAASPSPTSPADFVAKASDDHTASADSCEPAPAAGGEADAFEMSEVLGEIAQLLAESYASDSLLSNDPGKGEVSSAEQAQDDICWQPPKLAADLSVWNSALCVNNTSYFTPIDSIGAWPKSQCASSTEAGAHEAMTWCH